MSLIVSLLVMPFVYGFVTARLWAWFVEPLCHVHLGVLYAIGICELVSAVTLPNLIIPEKIYEPRALVLAAKAFTAALTLGVGWAVHLLIANGWGAA